jgi:hypothetical protein
MPKYGKYFEGNKCTEDVSPTNNITKAMIRPTVENKIFQYLNFIICYNFVINPLNAELNPIFPLLALFGAHHILNVSR